MTIGWTIGYPIVTRSRPILSENACETNSTDQKSTDSEGYGHGLLGSVCRSPAIVGIPAWETTSSELCICIISFWKDTTRKQFRFCSEIHVALDQSIGTSRNVFVDRVCDRNDRIIDFSGFQLVVCTNGRLFVNTISPIKSLFLRGMATDCTGMYVGVAPSSIFLLRGRINLVVIILLFFSKDQFRKGLILVVNFERLNLCVFPLLNTDG